MFPSADCRCTSGQLLPGFISVRGWCGETNSNWSLLLHIYLLYTAYRSTMYLIAYAIRRYSINQLGQTNTCNSVEYCLSVYSSYWLSFQAAQRMIELRVMHRCHAENDTLNLREEASFNIIAYHCSILFLNRLVIWLDMYIWSHRVPEIIKRASHALIDSVLTSSLTVCRK